MHTSKLLLLPAGRALTWQLLPRGSSTCTALQSSTEIHHADLAAAAQGIKHLHGAIRGALQGFSTDARALQQGGLNLDACQLAALAERHRFLSAVCKFHALSEDEVLFPAARWGLVCLPV